MSRVAAGRRVVEDTIDEREQARECEAFRFRSFKDGSRSRAVPPSREEDNNAGDVSINDPKLLESYKLGPTFLNCVLNCPIRMCGLLINFMKSFFFVCAQIS